jgi:hypothetical protein
VLTVAIASSPVSSVLLAVTLHSSPLSKRPRTCSWRVASTSSTIASFGVRHAPLSARQPLNACAGGIVSRHRPPLASSCAGRTVRLAVRVSELPSQTSPVYVAVTVTGVSVATPGWAVATFWLKRAALVLLLVHAVLLPVDTLVVEPLLSVIVAV